MKLVVCALVLSSSVAAADKPTLAVLGVLPKDASLIKASTTLDDGLRANLAKTYKLKGTARAIASAIRSGECSTSETACAVKHGEAFGVEYALAGELEKRGTHVELTIAIVDVATKQRIRSLRDKVGTNADFKKLAKKLADRLTGKGESGELVVVANVTRGNIYIDDELRGELFEGRATITLPQGRYKLAIEARGKKRFEDLVNVDQTTQLNVLLD